ncbi:MAG: flavin reductase family protein [Clostridia bacterium]|nr:flavin reductase family protein [Clostridia bacterium]
MGFKQTDIRGIDVSAVKLINDDWALVTSSFGGKTNTMTVSWGGLGELWGRDMAFLFIRPQRYTRELLDESEWLSVSFFGGDYKKELMFCGRTSGRDVDKFAETGLSLTELDGVPCVEQAQVNLICKKIAVQDIDPKGFLDETIQKEYPADDYHRVYVAQIIKTYVKE